MRPVPAAVVGLLYSQAALSSPALIRLDPRGESEWSREYPGRFEATDVALHIIDGEHRGYTFTGHGGDDGTLDGQLTRVNLDGEQVWSRAFGNPTGGTGIFAGLGAGEPQLIYDECWGIQGLADGGVIVACGTGIEGCDVAGSNARLRTTCQNDPRRVWRGYLVRFDATGEMVWERVDSFTEAGAADDVADAASEYVIQLQDGGFVSIVDQGFGIGLLGLGPDTQEPPADMGGDADISMNEDTASDDREASEPGNEMPEAEDDDRESPEDAFEADDAENGDDSETDRTEDDSAYEADDERGGEDEARIDHSAAPRPTHSKALVIWLLALLCVRRLRFL